MNSGMNNSATAMSIKHGTSFDGKVCTEVCGVSIQVDSNLHYSNEGWRYTAVIPSAPIRVALVQYTSTGLSVPVYRNPLYLSLKNGDVWRRRIYCGEKWKGQSQHMEVFWLQEEENWQHPQSLSITPANMPLATQQGTL